MITTYKMGKREDLEIKKTARCLELMDKHKVDDLVRDIYIKISIEYAIKYKMDTLLEFLSLVKNLSP